ncbi:MAG: sensor histidine kinase [Spirochaetota bacterium]
MQSLKNHPTELLSTWNREICRAVRESRAFCIGLFSCSGELLFANPAMSELLGEPAAAGFSHPRFEHFVETTTTPREVPDSDRDPDGPVFSGFITLTKDDEDRSILARVYRRDDQVLVLGETDVNSLAKQYDTVVELNRENNRLHRDLVKQRRALQQEVEQRKQSEARVQKLLDDKDVILREVHHRIKNNMNTVVSVLHLQAQMQENEAAGGVLQDAAERISSMMLLYDKLYQSSDLGALELDRYLLPLIEQVMAVFPQGASVQLRADVAPIRMKPKVLSELGIMVYELVTNAMKYAFAERGEGVLTVTAHQEGSAVSISVADDGPGLPEHAFDPDSPGFGMTLVNALADQLNATLRSENHNGAHFVLTFEPED